MRVSCSFVLLAVFIAAQFECAPISPSHIINHLDVQEAIASVPIVHSGNIISNDLAVSLHSSLEKRDISIPLSSVANVSGLVHGIHSTGSIPVALPAVAVSSIGSSALELSGPISAAGSTVGVIEAKRSLGLPMVGSMPVLSSLGSNIPMMGSGSFDDSDGVSNSLMGSLPISSLPTSSVLGMAGGAGGLSPLNGGLPTMDSLPGLSSLSSGPILGLAKRGLGFPMMSTLPMSTIPLMSSPISRAAGGLSNPLSGALPSMGSVPAMGSLPTSIVPGMGQSANALDTLRGAPSMMNSLPGLSSLPTGSLSNLSKRGLTDFPIIGALPLSTAAPVGALTGLLGNAGGVTGPIGGITRLSPSSFPILPVTTALASGVTGGLPMGLIAPLNSKRQLPGMSGLLGAANHLPRLPTDFQSLPVLNFPVPVVGTSAKAMNTIGTPTEAINAFAASSASQ